jgi:hypothetical protein
MTVKPGRSRYFEVFINLGLTGPKATLWTGDTTLIVDALRVTEFVDELFLESLLYELQIEGRSKFIKLQDFSGQLERDQHGIPYWRIVVETTSVTTGPCIGRAISKRLFQTLHTVDSSIKLQALNNAGKIERDNVLILRDTEWYPAYFSRATVTLAALLKEHEVQESIKDTPDRYRILYEALNLV